MFSKRDDLRPRTHPPRVVPYNDMLLYIDMCVHESKCSKNRISNDWVFGFGHNYYTILQFHTRQVNLDLSLIEAWSVKNDGRHKTWNKHLWPWQLPSVNGWQLGIWFTWSKKQCSTLISSSSSLLLLLLLSLEFGFLNWAKYFSLNQDQQVLTRT